MSDHLQDGYIRLSRKIKDSVIFKGDPAVLRLWIYLLLSMNTSKKPRGPYGEQKTMVGYGQFLRSLRKSADDCEWVMGGRGVKRWSPSQVQRILQTLENEGSISTRVVDCGTLITINKASVYQDGESYRVKAPDTTRHHQYNNKNYKKEKNTSKAMELWDVWYDLLGNRSTAKPFPQRLTLLNKFYEEHLKDDPEYKESFRWVIKAIRRDSWIMKGKRSWQMVDSLFASPAKRENRMQEGMELRNKNVSQKIDLDLWEKEMAHD